MKYDCVIVGGGASGLMLAAGMKVNKGVIVESTAAPGRKLLMTGGGRCNVTHAGSIKDFIDCYDPAGRRIRKMLYRHSNVEMVSWLESIGVPCVIEDNRYYPASMKASDVRDALVKAATANGWAFAYDCRISNIEYVESASEWRIHSHHNSDAISSDRIVIATGGITYPETGSDGSMFKLLRNLGVEITPLRSALAPVHVRDYPYAELSGVSIPDVTVSAFSSDAANTCKGKAARFTDDLLFTHTGFSGPAILKVSKYCEPGEMLRINYNASLENLPKRFRKILEDRARNQSGEIKTSKLAGLLESDNFVVQSIDARGIVTSGGISLDEVDLSTMQLKNHPGLYAIGEVLDIDGTTGGYNLQMCYSTAATAAEAMLNL